MTDRALGAGLAVLLFAVYALGASPTIYVGDSGELVTAVHLLGIPHPSGYPLYVMLGKLWTLLVPAGSIAHRMSLFSAACAAAACGILYLTGRAMRLRRGAALLGALLLAYGPSFWSQANIQRVYALNALFVVLATAALWRWHALRGGAFAPGREPDRPAARADPRADRWLVVVFLIAGLGATNHLFMGAFAACVGVFALLRAPDIIRRPRILAFSGAAFTAGLLPYLYLPLRSMAGPRLDWGNPETLEGFMDVVLRQGFWERAWIERPTDLFIIGADYLSGLGTEVAWLGLIPAVAGMLAWRRLGLFVILPVLVMGANFSSMALHGSRVDLFIWHRYYIPSYLMAALLAASGWDLLQGRLERRLHGIGLGRTLAAAVSVVVLVLPGALLAGGWQEFDRSRYRVADAFSRSLLEALPPGAHLVATDDNILFTSMYLHLVEGVRPDVDLILQGVGGADLPPLKFDPDTDPVFFTHHPNWNMPGLEIVPVGLTFRAWREGRPWPEPVLPGPWLEGERDPRVPRDHLTRNLMGHYHYMRGVTFEPHDWPGAAREFRIAAETAPDNDVLFYNLGLIYRRNGLLDESLDAFRRSRQVNPRHLASGGRPRASDRIREVQAELAALRELETELAKDPALKGIPPGTVAWHLKMAALLEARGQAVHARGHDLRARLQADGASPGG